MVSLLDAAGNSGATAPAFSRKSPTEDQKTPLNFTDYYLLKEIKIKYFTLCESEKSGWQIQDWYANPESW